MTYAKARSDFEYLESLVELDDQVELDSQRLDLMQEPTRAKACELYEAGIHLWFGEHSGKFRTRRIASIANRYGEMN